MGHCQIFFRSSLIARRSSLSPIASRPSPVFPFFPRPTSLVSPSGGGRERSLVARCSLLFPSRCSSTLRNGWEPFPTTAITCFRCRDCSPNSPKRKAARSGTAPKGRYTDHDVDTEKRRVRGPRPTASLLVSLAGGGAGGGHPELVEGLPCGTVGNRSLQPLLHACDVGTVPL